MYVRQRTSIMYVTSSDRDAPRSSVGLANVGPVEADSPRVLPRQQDLVALVRAGSARHREPLVLSGHERSLSEYKNPARTACMILTSADKPAWGRVQVPRPAAASPPDSCLRGGGHRGRTSPYGQGGATARRVPGVILDGRATSVPFTAVLTGPERTATDNAAAVPTCAVHRHRR
jgi:hypothetical protein